MVDIVDRIANGTAQLLGIEEICTRLDVSRTTFDRWVRNGSFEALDLKVTDKTPDIKAMINPMRGLADQLSAGKTKESNISFPPPDIRIGNSPKWEVETLKKWLRENTSR